MFSCDNSIFAFSPEMKEAYRVPLHKDIVIETMDCFSNQLVSGQTIGEIDFSRVNPATGPFYVEGVSKGDILVVTIKDIKLNDHGHVGVFQSFGVLNEQVKADDYIRFEVEDNTITFANRSFPANPMIGVMGVATAPEDGEIPTGIPGKHGGNMDTKDATVGAKLYFQVNCDGAMFALGDFHAAMGDGEATGSGGEIAGQTTVEFDVIKNQPLAWPMLETDDEIMFICSDERFEEAYRLATDQLVSYIQKKTDLTWEQSYMLASLKGDIRISQLVNPRKTIRAVIKKELLA